MYLVLSGLAIFMAKERIEDILYSFVSKLGRYGDTDGLEIKLSPSIERAYIKELGDFAHWFVDEKKLYVYCLGKPGVRYKMVKND